MGSTHVAFRKPKMGTLFDSGRDLYNKKPGLPVPTAAMFYRGW